MRSQTRMRLPMRNIVWGTRHPDGSTAMHDPALIVVGETPPDFVRLPPELGGAEVKVLKTVDAPCPKCATPAPICPTLVLANNMLVTASCPTHQFVWYRSNH